VRDEFSAACGVLLRWKQNCPLVPQINLHPRFDFQFVGEFRVQAGAGGGQRLKDGWCLEGAIDEHPTRGVRGFAAGLSALDD